MNTENHQSFSEYIDSLDDDEPVSIPTLFQLSDLSPDELSHFCERWPLLREDRRRVIVRHLADIAEENFVVDFSEIFGLCLEDVAVEVRLASLDGLWDTERVDLIEPIIQLMAKDPDNRVRASAAATLGHFVLMAEWGQIDQDSTIPAVESLLDQFEDPVTPSLVKGAALESLGAAAHPRVPTLIEDAYDSGETELQASALFAMGRSADHRWLPIVRDEMMSHEVEMRLEAARAAGRIGHSDTIPELGDLISDEDLEVRLAALTALGEIGGSVAQEILVDLTVDPEAPELHEAASEALEELDMFGSEIDFTLVDWDNEKD